MIKISNVFIYYTKQKMAEENTQATENQNIFNLIDKEKAKEGIQQAWKKVWGFMNWLVNFIKDKTWAKTQATENKKVEKKDAVPQTPQANKTDTAQNDTSTTLEQDVEKQEKQEAEEKKFNFDNVMSWVSNVLDKIEKKIWEKTWIDFDAPLKKREEILAKQAIAEWQQPEPTNTEPTTLKQEATEQPATNEEAPKEEAKDETK